MKFTNAQAGRITAAIKTGIRKASSKACADTSGYTDDIVQSAWCKLLTSYDPARDATYAGLRANRAKEAGWSKLEDLDPAFRPEALAYTIAYRLTLDYLKNACGKFRYADGHIPSDPISGDDDDAPMGEILPGKAPSAFQMVVASETARSLFVALSMLPATQRNAIMTDANEDRALTGAERIAKMRGYQKLRESLAA